ncbi:ABC transporter permease [Euzebya sp.]|uniref:ABC transporter permease n=1 Tax=Euzebya sp. TaxID=1971409 RepID=UPI0035192326
MSERQPTRPSALQLVAGQVRYAVLGVVRTPIAAFFTFAFPVIFVVLIGILAGDEVVDEATGVRVTQFATPGMMAFAVAMASFTTPASAMAFARQTGVLKRLRGTPLPAWAYLGGRVVGAALVALVAFLLTVVVAVLTFDVQVFARTLPQAALVIVLASASLAALAFAAVAVFRSAETVNMVTTGSVVMLGFVSDIFLVGAELPRPLALIGDLFPLSHLGALLRDAFHPFGTPAFGWEHLAVVAAWGVGATALAVWRFSWQPATRAGGGQPTPARVEEVPVTPASAVGAVVEVGRPGGVALLAGQVRAALLAVRRDVGSVFFAVLFPLLLVLLMPAVFGEGTLEGFDLPFVQVLAPAMVAYGVATHGFVNLPEQLARARDAGVLRRLRGTPLPAAAYLGGRLVAVVVVAVAIAVVTFVAAALVWDLSVPLARVPAAVVALGIGTAAMTALGVVVAGLARTAKSVPPISLGLLLPLSFVSDVFSFAPLPTALQVVGWAFPLKPFVHALTGALDGGSPAWAWPELAALTAWAVVGALVAARTFRWEPKAVRQGPAVRAAGAA